MKRFSFCLMVFAPLLLLAAGCASVAVDSPAFRNSEKQGNGKYHFRVANIDGFSSKGVQNISGANAPNDPLTPESVNRALREIRPDLYAEDGIPVSIRVTVDGMLFKGGDPLAFMLFYTSSKSPDNISVRIYEEDGVVGQKSTCPAEITCRGGMLPFAWMVPSRDGRHILRGSASSISDLMEQALKDFAPRATAFAMANALDAMSDGQIESLSRSVRLTRAEMTRRNLLGERSVETVHLADAEGTNAVSSTVEHGYKVVEQEAKASHPSVLKQEYHSNTFTGMVQANVSGFSKEAADEWLLRRLIPKICETKAAVWALDKLPPADAQFVITSDKTDENNVRTIHFRQIQ